MYLGDGGGTGWAVYLEDGEGTGWAHCQLEGGGWAIFLKKHSGEQKIILPVHMGHVQDRPDGVQTCTSLQESGIVILLASANKLIIA